ncbi:hypothetical protein [Methylobacterium sp. J-068]|uniref:hypothetical protein n=1 Tax=Methylobacterium sp. J-068 TaxID=2836649 RepID=UPI001FBB7A12|nr:hypothetical protein [Methylobacterium sp. J-068]MCJ2036070.1 hypothetical protein [Methylobacterium sp. J-068]
MVDETVSRIPALRITRDVTRTLLGPAAIAALAGAFAWTAPERNAWAAAALAAALFLDGLARAAGALMARRGLRVPRMAGPPSLVLPLRPGTGLAAALFATALALWPMGFPLLASALAGLIAMGAIARLALARVVLTRRQEPEA